MMLGIWGARHRSDSLFSVCHVWGRMISVWLLLMLILNTWLRWCSRQSFWFILGLFENYILKLKSSVKTSIIRGHSSVAFKKVWRHKKLFSTFTFWDRKKKTHLLKLIFKARLNRASRKNLSYLISFLKYMWPRTWRKALDCVAWLPLVAPKAFAVHALHPLLSIKFATEIKFISVWLNRPLMKWGF